ncbi:MAG: molybdopterin-dependent oxidoreductase, partial [Thermoanaerobaculia bacterium]|nr:molybdopterin-dependent oxidoreductase [Thermoanaerobaculia bacterium]
SQVCKYADQWVPLHAGSDGAFWMAVTHVILEEYHHQKQTPFFLDYVKRYTDSPYLVKLERDGERYRPGRLLRAAELPAYRDLSNGEWKFVNLDAASGRPVVPKGSSGARWDEKPGNWNMKWENAADDAPYDPVLTLLGRSDRVVATEFREFGLDRTAARGVPAIEIETVHGPVLVTTVYDLTMAQYGVGRGLAGDYPSGYEDEKAAYTPAWQELVTGVASATVLQFAREWAATAEATGGKCMIIVGAGINHWYHGNLMYRAGAMALMLTGCVGKNGGGLNHYVGQEKLAPVDSWGAIAFAKDHQSVARLQQAPIWHYINTCQYRYDGQFSRYNTVPDNEMTREHTADQIFQSVRMGWMPFYPQFDRSTLELCREAIAAGATDDEGIKRYVLQQLKDRELRYSVSDPEAEVNFPRVWYIWRGNAIMGSMKGHEYALKHYLGTHSNLIAKDSEDRTREVAWHEVAPVGKMDLVVDLNFRMDSSALYSDMVLPAASWYEKADLNSTDLHSFIHPLSAAIAPVWESKTDWNIFRDLAQATSEMAARYFPAPVK